MASERQGAMERCAGWGVIVPVMILSAVLGRAAPAVAASADRVWGNNGDWGYQVGGWAGWDGRGCVFGYKPGIDVLTPGYNPGPYPAYCPPPVAVYPAPTVAAPTAPLYLSAPSRYYCTLQSPALAGDRLSQVTESLCRDGDDLWAEKR